MAETHGWLAQVRSHPPWIINSSCGSVLLQGHRRTGTCQIRRVPPSSGVSTSKLPFNFSARLRMFTNPWPPSRPAPWMPCPLSRT